MPSILPSRTAALLACALSLTACASAGPTGPVLGPTVIYTDAGTFRDPGLDASPATALALAAPPGQVWTELRASLAALDLPVAEADSAAGTVSTGTFRARRDLGGEPLSEFLECGRTVGGITANTHEVAMGVEGRVEPTPGGGSAVRLRLEALATPLGTRGHPVPCASTGEMEERIASVLSIRTRSPTAGHVTVVPDDPAGRPAAGPVARGGGTVTGQVLEEGTGRPIEGARVRLEGNGAVRVTDASGSFRFERVHPGSYGVAVEHWAYEPRYLPAEVEPAVTLRLDAGTRTRTPLPLAPGTPLRALARGAGADPLRGRVLRADSQALFLDAGRGAVRLPYDGIEWIEVRSGRAARPRVTLWGAALGLAAGGAAGLAAGACIGDRSCTPQAEFLVGAALGTAVGSTAGLVLGRTFLRERRWVRLPLSGRGG